MPQLPGTAALAPDQLGCPRVVVAEAGGDVTLWHVKDEVLLHLARGAAAGAAADDELRRHEACPGLPDVRSMEVQKTSAVARRNVALNAEVSRCIKAAAEAGAAKGKAADNAAMDRAKGKGCYTWQT